jgi:rubredoxin
MSETESDESNNDSQTVTWRCGECEYVRSATDSEPRGKEIDSSRLLPDGTTNYETQLVCPECESADWVPNSIRYFHGEEYP